MKTKAAKIFSSIKYELIIFIILGIQAALNIFESKTVGEFVRPYYIVDFSMGKTSRLLIGSIVSLFTDNPTTEWINRFATVVVFLMIILVSILAGRVIKNVEKELKPQMLVLALFLVSGCFTFYTFSRALGFFDVYMFIIALISVCFLQNRYLRWLVPALCVAGVYVHQVFLVSYFPFVALVAFYLVITQKKKAANTTVLFVSAVATVAALLFCVLYGAETMTVSFEEMREIINRKGSFNYSEEAFSIIKFYFYNMAPDELGVSAEQISQEPLTYMLKKMAEYVNVYYAGSHNGLIAIFSLSSLIFGFFWAIWIKCARNTVSKARKFIYISFLLSTLLAPIICILAADYIRWIQAGVLIQFGLAFFMFYIKDEPFKKTMIQFKDYFSNKKMVLVVFYIVYALAVQRDLTG